MEQNHLATTRKSRPDVDDGAIENARSAARDVGISIEDLTALYILDSIKGLGPQACKALHESGARPSDVCKEPNLLPTKGKRGDKLRDQLRAAQNRDHKDLFERAVRQILAAAKYRAKILSYSHPAYPTNLYGSVYPVPILYVRGSVDVLQEEKTLACVGSRKIRAPYTEWESRFVRTACGAGFTIVSGFALGADSIGHRTAWESRGKTICVMPGGLDRPFPPENKDLWNSLLEYSGAVMVSELPFGRTASSLTLRKRNKLIVAFSRGVLIAQSSQKGGAMNAYRFALEQRKGVATFTPEAADDTSGNGLVATSHPDAVLTTDDGTYERWLQKLSSATWMEQSGTASLGMPLS
jgi:DNA processing protein